MTGFRCDECGEEFFSERKRNAHGRQAHPEVYQRSRPLSDAEAREIRSRLPVGPPHEDLVRAVALQFEVYRQAVFNIATGASYLRPSACPPDHPLRLEANAQAAPKQRIRSNVKPTMRKELGEQQGWRCVYCHRDISKRASVDHIVPIDQGGTSDPENLQLTCLQCNQSKGTLSGAEYRVKLANIQAALAYREERAQSMGWSSYEAEQQFLDCPCHHYGCPPGCPGCEMCGHPEGLPNQVICPARESGLEECYKSECRRSCALSAEVAS